NPHSPSLAGRTAAPHPRPAAPPTAGSSGTPAAGRRTSRRAGLARVVRPADAAAWPRLDRARPTPRAAAPTPPPASPPASAPPLGVLHRERPLLGNDESGLSVGEQVPLHLVAPVVALPAAPRAPIDDWKEGEHGRDPDPRRSDQLNQPLHTKNRQRLCTET